MASQLYTFQLRKKEKHSLNFLNYYWVLLYLTTPHEPRGYLGWIDFWQCCFTLKCLPFSSAPAICFHMQTAAVLFSFWLSFCLSKRFLCPLIQTHISSEKHTLLFFQSTFLPWLSALYHFEKKISCECSSLFQTWSFLKQNFQKSYFWAKGKVTWTVSIKQCFLSVWWWWKSLKVSVSRLHCATNSEILCSS